MKKFIRLFVLSLLMLTISFSAFGCSISIFAMDGCDGDDKGDDKKNEADKGNNSNDDDYGYEFEGGFGDDDGDDDEPDAPIRDKENDTSEDVTEGEPKKSYGRDAIFNETIGWYNIDPSAFEESDGTRYIYYTSNSTKWNFDDAIYVRKATKSGNTYTYGNRKKVLSMNEDIDGWDSCYIGGADVVKGTFSYNSTSYSYLMAYQATSYDYTLINNYGDGQKAMAIGLAVSNSPDSGWVKVGETPFIKSPASMIDFVGCYAPSLVNTDKVSKIRLFYTFADASGHFQHFTDFDASNLNSLAFNVEYNMRSDIVIDGYGLAEGGNEVLFPNADFVLDGDVSTGTFYVVKDYNPTADSRPKRAFQIELASCAANNLLTCDYATQFTSHILFDGFVDTDGKAGWERIFSGAIIGDPYGHKLAGNNMEFLYCTSDIDINEPYDFDFTPSIHSYIQSIA